MLSVSLGPVALPVAAVLVLLATSGASWLASRAALSGGDEVPPAAAGNAIVQAALLGLVAARSVYLGLHSDLYFDTPWSAFDVRDGGWHVPTGAIAAFAWLAWQGWRRPALRRPLATGGLAGMVFWISASVLASLGQARDLPSLAFTELDGATNLSLPRAARGRPVVLNLWASWCGPCRQEMPMMAAAQQRHPAVGFLFVNQGESEGVVRAYLANQGLSLREVLLDAESKLGPALGSRGLPTTLFYDAQGRQVDAHFGVLNAAALESRVRRLLAGSVDLRQDRSPAAQPVESHLNPRR